MKSSKLFVTFLRFIGDIPSKNGFIFRMYPDLLPLKMQLPQRHGKKWYEGESHYILLRVKQGIPPSKIAKEVSRTTNGITAQLKRIGYNSVQKGMKIEDASKLTGIPVDRLTYYIQCKDCTLLDLIQEVTSLRSRIEVLERRKKPAGSGLAAVRAGDEYLNATSLNNICP